MKEDIVDYLEKALYDLDVNLETNNEQMRINVCARLKGVIRDIKRYL